MKTLLIFMTMILSLQAKAQSPSYSLFYNKASDSHAVSRLCPEEMICIVDGTVIDLSYDVACTEDMVSFSYDAIEKGEDLHVYVSTVIGTNPPKDYACLGISHVEKQILLLNQYGKVVLHHMGVFTPIAK